MAQRPLDREIIEDALRTIAEVRREHPDLPDNSAGKGRILAVQAIAIERLAAPGISTNTITSRLRTVKSVEPRRWEHAFRGVYDEYEPTEATQTPRTVGDEAALHRAKSTAQEATVRLKDALAEISKLQDQIRDLKWATEANFRPAQWTLSAPGTGKAEHIPYLLTSDFQVGEVIDPKQTDHAHGYDAETFVRRYRALITATIELCLVQQSGWKYPGIIYARGGDAISGGIHEELAETDELTSIEAVKLCFEEEAAGISHLAEAFGRVDVKGTEEGGNHGRDTHKPRSKGAAAHSYEALIEYMLRREFKNDKRVTFQSSKSPDVYFPIYDHRILLTHGDKIGSRGGQGFVGPALTIARGAQKVIMEQQALGRHVNEVHVGHFHTALDLEYVIANGCLPGFSEYAKLNRLRPSPPSQWLRFYHKRFGPVCGKKIYLEEPRPADAIWDEAA